MQIQVKLSSPMVSESAVKKVTNSEILKAVKSALDAMLVKNSTKHSVEGFSIEVVDYPQMTSTVGEEQISLTVNVTLSKTAKSNTRAKPTKVVKRMSVKPAAKAAPKLARPVRKTSKRKVATAPAKKSSK